MDVFRRGSSLDIYNQEGLCQETAGRFELACVILGCCTDGQLGAIWTDGKWKWERQMGNHGRIEGIKRR